MPKRRPKKSDETGDIFDDARFSQAIESATAPVAPAPNPVAAGGGLSSAVESTPAPTVQDPSKVVAMTRPAERSAEPSEPSRGWKTTTPAAAPTKVKNRGAQTPEIAPEKPKSSEGLRGQEETENVAEEPSRAHEPHVTLKLRVPQSMRADYKRFTAELASVLGVTIDDSNIGRPVLEHFLNEMRERVLEAAESERGKFKRPANGDTVGMAEFDDWLGGIFSQARKRRRKVSSDD